MMLAMSFDDTAVLFVLTFAALVRATAGFGDALIAMPLLALLVGLEVATPLVGLVSVSTAVVMLLSSWQEVDLRSIAPFLAATAVGVPLGVWMLARLESAFLITGLGVLLIALGLYKLLGPDLPAARHPFFTVGLGLLAGLFGGAFNISGPVAVLYGGLRRWPPAVFRASLQGFFIVISTVIALSHGVAGLWSERVWQLYGAALPLTLAAIFAGSLVADKLLKRQLERLINVVVILSGVVLIF